MTNEMIDKQHQASLNAGKQFARTHGHSLIEETVYGLGHKTGSTWYRNNVWHNGTGRPTRLPIIHVWYHGNRVACVRSHENIPLQEEIDDINFQTDDK